MDIQKHYNVMHHDQEAEWFEPIPTLEGDIIEITEETLKANIALVKKEVLTEEEDDDDDELPDVPSIQSLLLLLMNFIAIAQVGFIWLFTVCTVYSFIP